MQFPIRIQVDSDLLLALSKYHYKEFYDINNIVHEAVEENRLHPSFIRRAIAKNNGEVPELLNDRWISDIQYSVAGDKYYNNLSNLIYLYNYVVEGVVEICASKPILKHFSTYTIPHGFIDKYVHVIGYTDKNRTEYHHYKNKIMDKYLSYKVLGEAKTTMHQSAYPKIAHASLQGLNLIVKRYDIYIHENPLVHDYKKATNVKDANIDMSLTFNTTLGKKYAPHPTTLDSFIVNLKKYFKNEQNYVYNYTESNIDDNFRFTPNVIPKFD